MDEVSISRPSISSLLGKDDLAWLVVQTSARLAAWDRAMVVAPARTPRAVLIVRGLLGNCKKRREEWFERGDLGSPPVIQKAAEMALTMPLLIVFTML